MFAGGADLEAIAAVTTDLLPDADPLDLAADLVDASLATITMAPDGEPRVGMLETIRAYSLGQLSEVGELADISQRHAHHYMLMAEAMSPQMFTGRQLQARSQLEMEDANLRTALTWSLPPLDSAEPSPTQLQIGRRLATAMAWTWIRAGAELRGEDWLNRATSWAGDDDGQDMARARHAFGTLLSTRDSTARRQASELFSQALHHARRLGDHQLTADVLFSLSWPYNNPLPLPTLRDMLQESIDLINRHDLRGLGGATYRLGEVEKLSGNFNKAVEIISRCRDLGVERGDDVFRIGMQDVLAFTVLEVGQWHKHVPNCTI